MKKEIEKPWCVYDVFTRLLGVGKVIEDCGVSVSILYSEGQHNPPEEWNTLRVRRFDTLEEAIDYYIKNRSGGDIKCEEKGGEGVRKKVEEKFPSYFQNKK
ncbi:MAG: hypothetical protein ABH804_01795 [archaeon]